MAVTKIDDYEVMYSSNTFPPRIWLKNAGKFIGQLIFQADGTALPQDSVVAGQANLYYHLENLDDMLDLLRNDEPLFLLFSGSGPGFENGIMTSETPPGK
jgi:hypothetical protein